jgi:hypothetical protein
MGILRGCWIGLGKEWATSRAPLIVTGDLQLANVCLGVQNHLARRTMEGSTLCIVYIQTYQKLTEHERSTSSTHNVCHFMAHCI